MSEHHNPLGQPIGFPVGGWKPCEPPPRSVMQGRYCRVEPIDPDRHVQALFAANQQDDDGRIWTYLGYGPFDTVTAYREWMVASCLGEDPRFHAIVDTESGLAGGIASYLRITPASGVIEVGHINLAPRLQRTRIATEAMYLMMRRVFVELGYRRYEWKCDALNQASKAAAERLGFVPEGVFRQATLYKGRNRDTAWFAIIDRDWPQLEAAYERWLEPGNFDAQGRQRTPLSILRP